jgi:hypothetical protein
MPEEAEANPQQTPKKGLPTKKIGIILGVAILQGGAFFAVFKMAGSSPDPAAATEMANLEETPQSVGVAEIALLKRFRVPNEKRGTPYIYDMDLSVVVPENRRDDMDKIASERSAEIADEIAQVVRAATPDMLAEDRLEILRAQFHEVLTRITNDNELIQRVLIPRFVPLPN